MRISAVKQGVSGHTVLARLRLPDARARRTHAPPRRPRRGAAEELAEESGWEYSWVGNTLRMTEEELLEAGVEAGSPQPT